MYACPLWYILGIGPSVIVLFLGLRAAISRGQTQIADYFDASGILIWLVPTLSVLAAGGYAGYALPIGSEAMIHTLLAVCAFAVLNFLFMVMCARIREESPDPLGKVIRNQLWAQGNLLGALAVLFYFSFIEYRPNGLSPTIKLAVAFYFAGIWASMLIGAINKKAIPNAQPLGVCELNRRVREIAKGHGLEISQVAILRNRQLRTANAMAISMYGDSTVILTEELVGNMTRDEVDAIVAHELGHCIDRNCWEFRLISTYALAFLWLALMALVELWIYTLPHSLQFLQYAKWSSVFVVPGLISAWYSRQREREADSNVGVLANPNADIRAYCKLHILNDTPVDRPSWSQTIATHPPGRARIRAIMRQFDLTDTDVENIFRAAKEELATPSGDRYELVYGESPAANTGGETIKDELLDRTPYRRPAISRRFAIFVFGGLAACILFVIVGVSIGDERGALIAVCGILLQIVGIVVGVTGRRRGRDMRRPMTERLLAKYGAEPEQPFLLADVMFNEDVDERLWQGSWLTTADEDLLVMGEARERRIDLNHEVRLDYEYSPTLSETFLAITYEVDSIPQQLLIGILGQPDRCESRNLGRLQKEIGKMIADAGGKLQEKTRLPRSRWIRVPVALGALSAAILFIHYTMRLTALDKLGLGYYPYVVCVMILAPMLWMWVWPKEGKGEDKTK